MLVFGGRRSLLRMNGTEWAVAGGERGGFHIETLVLTLRVPITMRAPPFSDRLSHQLLEAGAEQDVVDAERGTPLLRAVLCGHEEAAECLIAGM